MDWLLETMFKYPRRSLVVSLLIVSVCGSTAWWQFVWRSPQHTFQDMLANSLATTSVTRLVKTGNATHGVDETVRLEMAGMNATDWLVTATQTGSIVRTETIGIPDTGYIRYRKIATTAHAASGKPYNFDSALNIWAKSDGKTDTSLQGLFSQTLLDITNAPIPPIADMSYGRRASLLQFMHNENVYTPDYSKVRHETIRGRAVYSYSVKVKLGAYVRLMQAFAHDLGLTNLDNIDANQYASLAPITFTISVDALSHQLAGVAYAQTGFSQQYTDWGLLTPITIPAHGISTTELQARLQTLGTAN
jgi:hypothetical protein